jgi:hypothetical protein
MDMGAQILNSPINCNSNTIIPLSVLSIHARVLLMLSLTYGLSRVDFHSLIGGYTSKSFKQTIIKPLVKDRLIVGDRRSYGYIYSCTSKGRQFVSSELAKVASESNDLLGRVRLCSNPRKNIDDVLAGYFPEFLGK